MDKNKLHWNKTDALEAGDRYFYTRKPCKYGHDTVRLASCGACVECRKIYQRKRARIKRQDPEYQAYQREYHKKYAETEHGKEVKRLANVRWRERKKADK